jgi:predicted DNA-binding protein
MAQRSTPGTLSVPLNEDLRQRLNARAAEISKSVNDCIAEAVEQWLEVTEDDPRAGTATAAPEATAPV